MSFNSHRRNFSLTNTQSNTIKQQNRSLRKINQANPHYWIFISAKQHYNQGNNMQTAIKQFQVYLQHNPQHLQSLYLCAIAYMHLQMHRKAINKLVQYLTLRKNSRRIIINTNLPSISNAFLLLAIAYTKNSSFQKSFQAINQAIMNDSKFVQGYCFRAKISHQLGEIKKAYTDYLNALKYDPKCLPAIIGLGDYYSNYLGSYSKALKFYTKAKDLIKSEEQQQHHVEKSENNIKRKQNFMEWKPQKTNKQQIKSEIMLKEGICFYHIQQYQTAIKLFEKVISQKRIDLFSQMYYYLAMSQLKNYEEVRHKDRKKTLQYVQNNDLQQAILNLQYSIKTRTNKKVVEKAAKALIRVHIQNYQFYDACNVVELIKNNDIQAQVQKQLCEACMQVIKHKYEKAKIKLKKVFEKINEKQKQIEKNKAFKKNKVTDSYTPVKNKDTTEIKRQFLQSNKSNSQRFYNRKSIGLTSSQKRKHKINNSSLSGDLLKDSYQSYRHENQTNLPIDHNQSILHKQITANNQYQWMKPILYLFSAYSDFFSDSFIQCLQDFQLYQAYVKDYLGQDPQTNIYLSYNKVLCQGILMLDNQMVQESIDKFSTCIDNYYRLLKSIPIQPILFKFLALLKLALSENPQFSIEINSKQKILMLIIENFQHYQPILQSHYLAQYYHGLILMILKNYREASDAVEVCLKNVEECQWKYLYVKGVIEINNEQYKTAIKQFSAGLLLQEKSELYLGRCISYLLFHQEMQEKNGAIIQKSFEDLQKFIQLENDKQKISKWVTKILFFNRAYEEARKSFKKCSIQSLTQDDQLAQIDRSLNIFEGNFQDGGVVGRILINAFEKTYAKNYIDVKGTKHEINQSDFISDSYCKWLNILNFYSMQNYKQLIKYLQREIFDAKDSETELIQLKYNLFVVYLLNGEAQKAKNIILNLQKIQIIQNRARKFIDCQIVNDQCFEDLQQQFRGIKRVSSFLPYRRVIYPVNHKSQKQLFLFIKISVPFPDFAKPVLQFTVDQNFLSQETAQSCIPKKIEAPWVKKVTGKIQFTDVVIESLQSSILIEGQSQSNTLPINQRQSSLEISEINQ